MKRKHNQAFEEQNNLDDNKSSQSPNIKKIKIDLEKKLILDCLIEENSRLKQKLKINNEITIQKDKKISNKRKKILEQKQEIFKQKQEIFEQKQKVIKKKTKISVLKDELYDKDLALEKKIYESQKKEKQVIQLEKEKQKLEKSSIKKSDISKSLIKALNINPSKKLLVSINKSDVDEENKFEVVGRVEVKDGKQHRHITPHALLTKTLENAIKSAENLKDLYENLSEIISILINPKGICLKESEYKELDFVKDTFSRKITTNKNTYYFIDNGNEYFIDCKKIKIDRQESAELYQKKYVKYLIHHLTQLAEKLNDDNSLTVACELLARFIYTTFNKHSTVSFPDEGNSLNYEIRLYNNVNDAKSCNNQYKILTVCELEENINKLGNKKISKKIRIVDNEGSNVKKSIAALQLLNDIISKIKSIENYSEELKHYNRNFNKTLRSENVNLDLNNYNEKLNEEKFASVVVYHIAKQLYFLFDFKPLESKVFVMSDNDEGIEVFFGASAKDTSLFKLVEGKNFREIERNNYKGTLPCRSENTSNKLLAEKIVTHTNLALLCFKFFSENFETDNLNNQIIKNFTQLVVSMNEIKDNLLKEYVLKRFGNSSYGDIEIIPSNVKDEDSLIEYVNYNGQEEVYEYNQNLSGDQLITDEM